MSEEKNNENELLSKEDNSETPFKNPSNADELRYDINHYNFISL